MATLYRLTGTKPPKAGPWYICGLLPFSTFGIDKTDLADQIAKQLDPGMEWKLFNLGQEVFFGEVALPPSTLSPLSAATPNLAPKASKTSPKKSKRSTTEKPPSSTKPRPDLTFRAKAPPQASFRPGSYVPGLFRRKIFVKCS